MELRARAMYGRRGTSNDSSAGRLDWLNFSRHSLDATIQFMSSGDALIIRTRSDSTLISGMCGLCPLEIYTFGCAGMLPFMVGVCSARAVAFATSSLLIS
jgi:hypothetical protein